MKKKERCQLLEKNIVLMEETSGGVIEAGTSEAIEAVEANSVRIRRIMFHKAFLTLLLYGICNSISLTILKRFVKKFIILGPKSLA